MAELLIRGSGRPPQCRDEALAAQAAWVAHRRRKVAAQVVLANQIQGQLDLIFPGLTGCFAHGLDAASLRVLIRDLPDPDRVRRLGVEGVLRFVRRRGVQMSRPKAEQVMRAGPRRSSITQHRTTCATGRTRCRLGLVRSLRPADPRRHHRTGGAAAPDPAGVLLGIPGVGVLTASSYGRQSLTRSATATPAPPTGPPVWSRSVTNRPAVPGPVLDWDQPRRIGRITQSIIELGRSVGSHHPDFITYRRQLLAHGKPPLVAPVGGQLTIGSARASWMPWAAKVFSDSATS